MKTFWSSRSRFIQAACRCLAGRTWRRDEDHTDGRSAALLPQVRHGRGGKSTKWFRISLGDSRVYTTLAIEFETVGKAQPELLKQGFLLSGGFGDAPQADLTAVGSGKDDVGTLH